MNLVKEIPASHLAKHSPSSRSCRWGSSCEMEGKLGRLTLDFSSMPGSRCVLNLSRKSGNGRVVVLAGGQVQQLVVLRARQAVPLELSPDRRVEIRRPYQSTGVVSLLDVQLFAKGPHATAPGPWLGLLRTAPSDGIHLSDVSAWAFSQGWLRVPGLRAVQTDPPGLAVVKDERAFFVSPCEILDVLIQAPAAIPAAAGRPAKPPAVSPAPPAAPKSPPEAAPKPPAPKPSAPKAEPPKAPVAQAPAGPVPVVVFDTAPKWPTSTVGHRYRMEGEALRLEVRGRAVIPLQVLPGADLKLILEAKRLSGNGRLSAHLLPRRRADRKVWSAGPEFGEWERTGLRATAPVHLVLERPPGSTGDVLIRRARLVVDEELDQDVADQSWGPGLDPAGRAFQAPPSSVRAIDSRSKRFAVLPAQTGEVVCAATKGKVRAGDGGSARWLTNVSPLFPQIDKVGPFFGLSKAAPTFGMGPVETLGGCRRVWLPETARWDLSEKDTQTLKSAKLIASPSLPNVQFLRRTFSAPVLHLPRPWPAAAPVLPVAPAPYALYIERRPELTPVLFAAWPKNLDLVCLGPRGTLPKGIRSLDPYASYGHLLGALLGSRVLVDLDVVTHYSSGLLDLAFLAGVPVITTNQWLWIARPPAGRVSLVLHKTGAAPDLTVLPQRLAAIPDPAAARTLPAGMDLSVKGFLRTMLGEK